MTNKTELNMSREYRGELKTLRVHLRKLLSDRKQQAKDIAKKMRALDREDARGQRATNKVVTTINRRIAILEGRLS